MKDSIPFKNIDEYIALQPLEVREKLEELRVIILKAAPEAEETISYKMPAFKYHGMLVYFAANKNHIGFYPTSTPIIEFEKELNGYVWSKGAIQFPLNQEIPEKLVTKMVQFKVKENLAKGKKKYRFTLISLKSKLP